jgi:hypothetical protein
MPERISGFAFARFGPEAIIDKKNISGLKRWRLQNNLLIGHLMDDYFH